MEQRSVPVDDPPTLRNARAGDHVGHWRGLIGDYQVVARVEDERAATLVVRLAHRRGFIGKGLG